MVSVLNTYPGILGADITSSLGMKATIELCHQKCRLIQACTRSHNLVGIYIMGVGAARCIEASHFNKGMVFCTVPVRSVSE